MIQAAQHPETARGHSFDPTILRAYDIRGVVDAGLSVADAYMIGRCFASSVIRETGKANPTMACSYDGRVSSPSLSQAVREGMRDAGATVLDTGLGPTPMLYFAVKHLKLDAGIMVTGSHNPPDQNGFKMMLAGRPFFGEDIAAFAKMAEAGDVETGQGNSESKPIFDVYVASLIEALNVGKTAPHKTLNVAWDPGNGAAGEAVEALVKKLPGEHHVINGTIDGSFPAHHPDPTVPENLEQLIALVKEKGCDFGVAFDGDGDRIGAVDPQGRIIWGDQLMVLYSRSVLEEFPGAAIIADVKASQLLFTDIAEHGGKPIMWKTGHSLVKAKMAETGAKLAGEMSGHIFFADHNYGYDDGIYAAVRLLGLLTRSDEALEAQISALPQAYNTPEIRIDCDESRKFVIVDEIRDRLTEAGADVNAVDGVRVNTPEGWWLARASNTQPAIIVRAESTSEDGLSSLKSQLATQLKASNVTGWEPHLN